MKGRALAVLPTLHEHTAARGPSWRTTCPIV
jgi:hypothetical protein